MEIVKDEKILKIIEKLKNAVKLTKLEGHVFLTGGTVRDSLLGLKPTDVDVAVDAKEGGIVVANLLAAKERSYVLNTNPVIFPTYGTAKVCLFKDEDLKNINIEFVETRKCSREESKDCFGTIEEDSKRRDLTINSLYWNINDGKLYDFNGGVDDMTTQTLRTVNPDLNFKDSPIRMMRVIRFSAELGWGIEKETWLSILKNSHLIKKVSQELITNELSKILISNNASMGIRKLLHSGLLRRILPDICDLNSVYESRNPMLTVFDHTMKVVDAVNPMIESRLAALFHDIGSLVTDGDRSISQDMFSAEVAATTLRDMKYSHKIIEAVEKAIKYHKVFAKYEDGTLPPDKRIRKFMNLVGSHLVTTMDLVNANNLHCTYGKKKRQALDILNRIEELTEEGEKENVKLPIDGNTIIKELKIKRGPIVGKILNAIRDEYFENPNITKEECLEIAKTVLVV